MSTVQSYYNKDLGVKECRILLTDGKYATVNPYGFGVSDIEGKRIEFVGYTDIDTLHGFEEILDSHWGCLCDADVAILSDALSELKEKTAAENCARLRRFRCVLLASLVFWAVIIIIWFRA